MRTALDGADTLFFVSATEHPDRVGFHATVVDAAVAAGVARHTFLRDAMYADFEPGLASVDGVLRGPAGDRAFTPVTQQETVQEAYASRASYGAPAYEVDGWVSTYTAIAKGELDVLSRAVSDVTGRAPISLRGLLTTRPELLKHLA